MVILYNVLRSFFLDNTLVEINKVVLNLLGFFGFFSWDNNIGMGVWSIGNELVFYALFPLLIFALHKSKFLYFSIYLSSFLVFLYFTFFKLTDVNDTYFWHNYTNPLNHFFYFTSGVTLGIAMKYEINTRALFVVFICSALFFVFWPVLGSEYNVAIGLNRVLFSISSIIISFFFLHQNISYPVFLNRFFSFLGEISYSIYLLHPIVISTITFFWYRYFNTGAQIDVILVCFSLILTIISSYISYRYFEKYFMKLAKKY